MPMLAGTLTVDIPFSPKWFCKKNNEYIMVSVRGSEERVYIG